MVPARASASSSVEVKTELNKDEEGVGSSSRYVASNRFSINPSAAAKFEARWATRKSRLAVLEGFRYFSLLRLTDFDTATDSELSAFNYVSFTIWSNKSNFNSWRTGEAFKEAHGGGTIFGFVDMLVNSIGVLKGPPKPIFYDGKFPTARIPPKESKERVVSEGWRVVEANGKDKIDSEVFADAVAFQLSAGKENAYETFWGENYKSLTFKDSDFICSLLLKRDSKVKMHGSDDPKTLPPGTSYVLFNFSEDKAKGAEWKKAVLSKLEDFKNLSEGGVFSTSPESASYEGILTLENPDIGA